MTGWEADVNWITVHLEKIATHLEDIVTHLNRQQEAERRQLTGRYFFLLDQLDLAKQQLRSTTSNMYAVPHYQQFKTDKDAAQDALDLFCREHPDIVAAIKEQKEQA